jgi:hypothetical protein
MLRRAILIFVLAIAAAAAGPASADIRRGKLAAWNLTLLYDRKAEARQAETETKEIPPVCSALASADADEKALALRLRLLGACAPSEPPPRSLDRAPAWAPFIFGSGACSVVGEVGRSCR